MKLLHVVRRLDAALGGAPAAAAHMAAALSDKGHDVTLATTVREDGNTDELCQLTGAMGASVRVEPFPRTRAPFDHSLALRTWLGRNASSYDLIEVHGVFDYPSCTTSRQSFRCGRPYVIHPHGSLDPFDLQKHRTAKRAVGPITVRRALSRSSGVLVATRREGSDLVTFGANPPVYALALPYRSSTGQGHASLFRKRFDIAEGLIVLFLGRIDYKKGLYHLVAAVNQLVDEGLPVTLVVAGDSSSSYATALRSHVAERRLDQAIRFVGHLDEGEKADALAAATALALVSDNENYGLVLVEAARAGVPMILSDQVYMAPELVGAGAALLVSRDGAHVAEALRRLATDARLAADMSAAARTTAAKRFDWEQTARAHSELRVTLLNQWNERRRV